MTRMIPLLYLMIVGVIMGHFFNFYMVATASVFIAFAIIIWGGDAGLAHAVASTVLGLCCFQFGYLMGILAWSRIYASRPFSLLTRR